MLHPAWRVPSWQCDEYTHQEWNRFDEPVRQPRGSPLRPLPWNVNSQLERLPIYVTLDTQLWPWVFGCSGVRVSGCPVSDNHKKTHRRGKTTDKHTMRSPSRFTPLKCKQDNNNPLAVPRRKEGGA